MSPSNNHQSQVCRKFAEGYCRHGDNCYYLHPVGHDQGQQQTQERRLQNLLRARSADEDEGHGTPLTIPTSWVSAAHGVSNTRFNAASVPGSPTDTNPPTIQLGNEEPRPLSLARFYADYCLLNGYDDACDGPSRELITHEYKKLFKDLVGHSPRLLRVCLDQLRTPEAQALFEDTPPPKNQSLYRWRPTSDSDTNKLKAFGEAKMVHDNGNTIITPYYGDKVLESIDFPDFCRRTRELNSNRTRLSEAALRYVFQCIVHNVFFFEEEATKSAVEGKLRVASTVEYGGIDEVDATEEIPLGGGSHTTLAKNVRKRKADLSDTEDETHTNGQEAEPATLSTDPSVSHTLNLHNQQYSSQSEANSAADIPQLPESETRVLVRLRRLRRRATLLQIVHDHAQLEIAKLSSKAGVLRRSWNQAKGEVTQLEKILDTYCAATQAMLDAQLGVFH